MDHGRTERPEARDRQHPRRTPAAAVGRPGSALAPSAAELERFFRLSQDLFAVVDLEGNLLYANPAWTQVLAFDPEEVVGRPLTDFLLPEDWRTTRAASRLAIAQGHLDGFENRFRHKGGGWRWLQWSIQVDGELGVAYGIGRDTSARHAAESAQAVSEATYRALVDSSIDGVMILDADGAVLAANHALTSMLGYSADAPGPAHRNDLIHDGDPRFDAALAERRATGRFFGELTFVRVDGTEVPVEVSAARFADDAGHERVSLVVRDITERRALESAVEVSAWRMRVAASAMNAAANAIVIADAGGTIEWVNRAFTELTGYTAEDAVGRKTSLLRSGEHSVAFYRQLWDTINTGEVWEGELINRRKDGSLYPEAQTITPVIEEDGSITRFIAIKQDVSERKQAERALRVSEASFRQLFRDNPLPMYVFDGASLAFLAVNEAMVRHYGYSEAELLGMTIRDIRPPEDVDRLERHLRDLQEPFSREGLWRHVTKDGRHLDVDITTHVLDFQGHDARLTVAQDVSDRMRAERDLQTSEERYRMLAENAADVVFRVRVRPEFAYEYVSPSVVALAGYAPEELYGQPERVRGLMHPDDLADLLEIARAGKPFLARVRRYHKDGHVIHTEQHSRPVLDDDGDLLAIEGIIRDVTPQVENELRISALNERLETHLERFKAIHRVDTAILVDGPLRGVLHHALDEIVDHLGVDAAAVYRTEPDGRQLTQVAARGMPAEVPAIPVGQGIAGEVARSRAPLRVVDIRDRSSSALHDVRFVTGLGFRGCFVVPLINMGRLEGVLELFSVGPMALDDDAQVFAETIAQQAALAFQRDALVNDLQGANQDLQAAYDDTIEGWARALDLKDEETAGHSQRVTELTLHLAERLGVPSDELEHVRRGALLHDIGKMGIPDSILLKPGRLTEEEFAVIRRHPVYSADMLKDIAFLQPAMAIPRWHHERWDGTGYPDGLAGEAIPLAARIFAVIDVFDALTSDRPYRKAWTREDALAHIREGRGSHFDPHVADAFLAMLED